MAGSVHILLETLVQYQVRHLQSQARGKRFAATSTVRKTNRAVEATDWQQAHLLPQGLVRSLARLTSAQVSTVALLMNSTMNTDMPHFPAHVRRMSALARRTFRQPTGRLVPESDGARQEAPESYAQDWSHADHAAELQ